MNILSIETSCDETGISILEGDIAGAMIQIRGNALASQVDLHATYGGVFPAMAKRAHVEKFVPLLHEALSEAGMLTEANIEFPEHIQHTIAEYTNRDPLLHDAILSFLHTHAKPDIEYIAVTTGPGLEPALWVGITAAKVLSIAWNIPLIPINHMEGHVLVTLLKEEGEKSFSLLPLQFPSIALLVSGGHTELVVVHTYAQYEKIGATRDDAVGEAFDKVARMLGLPYPGGPAVSNLARTFREKSIENPIILPRPMIHSKEYDFSFSGIKTAVLYTIRDIGELTEDKKEMIAAAFEDACIEVLVSKTMRAIREYHTQTVIVGGGVAGNAFLKKTLSEKIHEEFPHMTILFPKQWLATDNSVMIGVAAYMRIRTHALETILPSDMKADGNLSITDGGFRK